MHLQYPETIKLPDSNISPLFFITVSASPVIKDSLTSTLPYKITESTTTWFPISKMIISSKTILFISISSTILFLRIFDFVLAITDNLSIVFFERISCIIPITILQNITPKKNKFL